MDGKEHSLISSIYRHPQVQGALEECLRSKFQHGWIFWKGNCVRICLAARKKLKFLNHMIQTKEEKKKEKKKDFCFQKSPKRLKIDDGEINQNNNLFRELTCRQNTQSFDAWKLFKKVSLFQNSTILMFSFFHLLSKVCNVDKLCCCCYSIFRHQNDKGETHILGR